MADIDLKTATPDTSLPTTGFLFGADSQASASPSVYSTQTVATTLLGSTSLTGATITTSQPVLDLAQTWNAGAVTFTGLKFNAAGSSDANSAAASLLMDLQVDGSSRFNVGKTGNLKLGVSPTGTNQAGTNVIIAGSQGTGTGAGGSIIFQVAPAGTTGTAQNALATALTIAGDRRVTINSILSLNGDTAWLQAVSTGVFQVGSAAADGRGIIGLRTIVGSGGYYAFSSTNSIIDGNYDVALHRDAANTLALRNGANAQTFRVYNTWTSFGSGTEIWERGKFAWESNVLRIGTEKGADGGTARALEFQTDGTTRLTLSTAGNATFSNEIRMQGGQYLVWLSQAAIRATASGIVMMSNSSVDNFNRLVLGVDGGTAYPALKRSSAKIHIVDGAGNFTNTSGLVTQNLNLQGVTIANLPGTPTAGDIAYITDGDASLAWGATAVNSGSGATKYLVWYNGTNWTVAGK